jgi:hypothetical protein
MRCAVVAGCRVQVDVRTKDMVVTGRPTTTAADRNAVTAWVLEQLREAGWQVADPLEVRNSLWQT